MRKNKSLKRYMYFIIFTVLTIGTSTTVLAADDPLTVINNLSDFLFGLLKAVGMITLGYSIFQIGSSFKSQDPSQRANGIMCFGGGIIMTFAKEILDLITK